VKSGGDLSFGTTNVGGDLTATAIAGDITQSGPLNVDGTTQLSAVNGNITLEDPANDFSGAVSLIGVEVTIVAANDLTLDNVTTSADFTVTSGGDLSFGTTSVGGDLTATATTGDITQSGPLNIDGNSQLSAVKGDIRLNNPANDFSGAVSLSANDATIYDSNGLVFGNILSSGNFVVSANGDIDFSRGATVAGDFAAESNGGNISRGAPLDVRGDKSIDAGGGAVILSPVELIELKRQQDALMKANHINLNVFEQLISESQKTSPAFIQNIDFGSSAFSDSSGSQGFGSSISIAMNSPYPLEFAFSSEVSSGLEVASGKPAANAVQYNASSGSAEVYEGPLSPDFKVENQRTERFSMAKGSLLVEPGSEVCLFPAGCSVRITSEQPSAPIRLRPADLLSIDSAERFNTSLELMPSSDGCLAQPDCSSRTEANLPLWRKASSVLSKSFNFSKPSSDVGILSQFKVKSISAWLSSQR